MGWICRYQYLSGISAKIQSMDETSFFSRWVGIIWDCLRFLFIISLLFYGAYAEQIAKQITDPGMAYSVIGVAFVIIGIAFAIFSAMSNEREMKKIQEHLAQLKKNE